VCPADFEPSAILMEESKIRDGESVMTFPGAIHEVFVPAILARHPLMNVGNEVVLVTVTDGDIAFVVARSMISTTAPVHQNTEAIIVFLDFDFQFLHILFIRSFHDSPVLQSSFNDSCPPKSSLKSPWRRYFPTPAEAVR